jgi:hypothetical protein
LLFSVGLVQLSLELIDLINNYAYLLKHDC